MRLPTDSINFNSINLGIKGLNLLVSNYPNLQTLEIGKQIVMKIIQRSEIQVRLLLRLA